MDDSGSHLTFSAYSFYCFVYFIRCYHVHTVVALSGEPRPTVPVCLRFAYACVFVFYCFAFVRDNLGMHLVKWLQS